MSAELPYTPSFEAAEPGRIADPEARLAACRAEVTELRAQVEAAGRDPAAGVLRRERRFWALERDYLTQERDAARAAAIEEAAQVADSYGRVWRDRPGPALANTIAAKIRALDATARAPGVGTDGGAP